LTKRREDGTSYQQDHPEAKISWLIEVSGVSKNGWYHKGQEKSNNNPVKEQIEKILIKSPYYGYKRITKYSLPMNVLCHLKLNIVELGCR